MKIAVIDDEFNWRKKAIEEIKKFYKNRELQLDEYESGDEFLKINKEYDVAFVDIEMEGKDGFDTIKQYSSVYQNTICIILTTHTEVWKRGFQVNAFRYIDKKNMCVEIEEALKAVDTIKEGERPIKLHEVGFYDFEVKIKDIVFVETIKRNVIVHTCSQEYTCNNTISELEQRLVPYGFYRCHKSILINLDWVKKFNHDTIYFKNGWRTDLSKKKYAQMRSEYIKRRKIVANM